mgnify:CR=1 FL=1
MMVPAGDPTETAGTGDEFRTMVDPGGIPPDDLVFIAEFCGGGFGSKGGPYPLMTIPAHLSRKISRPVLMRISRAEEYVLGSARRRPVPLRCLLRLWLHRGILGSGDQPAQRVAPLTIRPSRRRFAARLNSGVRPLGGDFIEH